MDDFKRYKHGNVSCLEAIKSALSPEEFRGFCKGNVIKYVWRESFKGHDNDLDKAVDYCLFAMGFPESGIYSEDRANISDDEFFEMLAGLMREIGCHETKA